MASRTAVVVKTDVGPKFPVAGDSTAAMFVNAEGRRATYSAIGTNIVPSGAIAPSLSIQGSNSKVIRVTRVYFTATAATGALVTFFLCRFTSISGGLFAIVPPQSFDLQNSPSQAFVQGWTAAATTIIGGSRFALASYEIVTQSPSVIPQVIDWSFGNNSSQPLVVRGTADFVGFGVTGIGTTPTTEAWIQWTEE